MIFSNFMKNYILTDFPDNKFDIITTFFVLHHIDTLDNTMKELKRVLKPNGILLFLDHNALSDSDMLLLDIQHLLYAIIYNKNYEYLDKPLYAKYYNYMEWDYIFSKYNFNYINHFK
jgi:ubiquinone/menaquinone biosynthesis C-methylase UbiE